jgi:hypothetical protein
MKKSEKIIPSNDAIREDILATLHDAHRKSRSPKSAAILLSVLARTLKTKKGYKLQEVSSNLDYLVQKTWVTLVREPRSFQAPGGTRQDSERITYKISAIGIDKRENGSLFKAPPIGSTMNITTINGVTVVGDGNVVNTNYSEASKLLSELRDTVARDQKVPDGEKLSTLSDIDSLSAQLQKPSPNAGVIKMLWKGIEGASAIGGAATLIHQAAIHLAPLLK